MNQFISELMRRNVVRAAVAYLAISWMVLQVGTLVTGLVGLSAALMRDVLIMVVLAFVPVILFAWMYELTPAGLRRHRAAVSPGMLDIRVARWLNASIIAALAMAVLLLLIDRFFAPAVPVQASGQRDAVSIAVLPFVNISSDKEQDYFSDGLSETLLDLLAHTPRLRVIARTSSFSFKGRDVDIATIARTLNVANILEGSVRKSGSQIQILAQLVRASDSSELWSQTYDRKLTDVFAVQDDIAAAVIKELKVKLLGAAAPTVSRSANTEAYTLYLQANYLLGRRKFPDAIAYYRRSLQQDPSYALGWAGLSLAYSREAGYGALPLKQGYELARDAARKAIALDPRLPEANVAMAVIQADYDWDWAAARASLDRTFALDPDNVRATIAAAKLAFTFGRIDEAIEHYRKALVLDPLHFGLYEDLSSALICAGKLDEAAATLAKVRELEPSSDVAYDLALVRLAQGQPTAALAAIKEETEDGWRTVGSALAYDALGMKGQSDAAIKQLSGVLWPYNIGAIYAHRGDRESAFAWLDRAFEQHDPGLLDLKTDPLLAKLRSDPRYSALLKKMKLL